MIRRLEDADLPELVEHLHDRELTKYMTPKFDLTVEESRQHHEDNRNNCGQSWAIVDNNGQLAGCIELHHVDAWNKTGQLSIIVWKQGQGLAGAAIREVMDYSFKIMGLHKLKAGTHYDNNACIGVFVNSGFKVEAILHDELMINGRYESIILMGCVNESIYNS